MATVACGHCPDRAGWSLGKDGFVMVCQIDLERDPHRTISLCPAGGK